VTAETRPGAGRFLTDSKVQETAMADEAIPDKRVDEDWKRRVADEKRAAESPEPGFGGRGARGPAPAGTPTAGRPGAPPPASKETRRTGGPQAGRRPDPRFLQFVQAIAAEALMSLGQMPNPMTGQLEQDLHHAKGSIETLMMLQEKTQGNLTPEEESALKGVVAELQGIYVQLAS
jgi:hypothetical protein